LRHSYAILEAPSALGRIPEHLGVERAPGVLLEAGLAEGLNARRAGCLPADGYSSVPDPRTKVMNPQPLHEYSRSLADQVEAILDNGEFPVVLGGDCSLLLGAMLALRRRGRYGVLAEWSGPRRRPGVLPVTSGLEDIQDGLRPQAEISGGEANPMPRSTAARWRSISSAVASPWASSTSRRGCPAGIRWWSSLVPA
jgi:Arginase family